MKKVTKKIAALASAALLLLALSPLLALPAAAESQAGTAVSGTQTASGGWDRVFGWTITKTAQPDTLSDSGTVGYTVAVTKDSGTDHYYAQGQVCLANDGVVATESLKIVVQVLYKAGPGPYQNLVGASQTIVPSQQLAPAQEDCYAYKIEFTPVAGASYKSASDVTITNHSGKLGEEFGPKVGPEEFSLPTGPTLVNDTVNVDDTNGSSWAFSASGSVQYQKSFACPADAGVHVNRATIRETGQYAEATVTVTCPTGTGPYAMGIGYWKTHAGLNGNNENEVGPLLPVSLGTSGGSKTLLVNTVEVAVGVLGMDLYGDASNGITKLYAQLLAAKLNVASGVSGSSIASTVGAADGFLGTHNHGDWEALSKTEKQTVLEWMATLESFNEE